MGLRVGVDIGGSFTDFAVLDEEKGTLHSLKVFSRPDMPGAEVIEGMRQLQERYQIDPSEVVYFTHGTTVGVNTVVQRNGIRLGLITNRYFEDVLAIARLKIPNMYNLMSTRAPVLVSRECIFGIDGRLEANGNELEPISRVSVQQAIDGLRAAGCEGIVVSLLHSYRNPQHEHEVKAQIKAAMPDLHVTCSCDVWPIIREYERTLTAVIGAYVQPRVEHYLTKLQGALLEAGVNAELKVTKSNGGVMSAERGKSQCVQMILSGTASGVIGAAWIAELCQRRQVMSLDIGGTTADVALIKNGQPLYGTGEYIGDYQLHVPSVSVTSIGDGGGSIAWIDHLGILRVGPRSAGSTPGPVCYGRGGTEPTITDAFAVLGVLGQAALGYNAVQVDTESSRKAIATLATQLDMSVEQVAERIVELAVSGMYAGISRLVSRFGIDPREFSLMPFGGAGPMLAAYLARALGMPEIIVPVTPGVLSALGGLIAEIKNDFVRITYYDLNTESLYQLKQDFHSLEKEARQWLQDETGNNNNAVLRPSAEMRYKGQSFEIEVPLTLDHLLSGDIVAIRDAFHQRHAALYGYRDEHAAIQVVSLRLVASHDAPKPHMTNIEAGAGTPPASAMIDVWINGAWRHVPLYLRHTLKGGQCFEGPAIIAQDDTTTVVLPEFNASIDSLGNLMLSLNAAITEEM